MTAVELISERTMADNWPAIQAAAGKSLLVKVDGQNEPARFAQDRAARVVRCIDRLAPVVNPRVERVDLVRIAALYACVAQCIAGPTQIPDESAYDDAAEMLADQLKDLLPADDLDGAIAILKHHRKRVPPSNEAKLLADALTMEEFGLIGLWNQARAFHSAGKSVEQLIKLFKAQQDYGYWEARLRDGFHFDASREAARQRLGQMKGLYEHLQREHLCEDIGGMGIY